MMNPDETPLYQNCTKFAAEKTRDLEDAQVQTQSHYQFMQ
jgi:hypothetical protein